MECDTSIELVQTAICGELETAGFVLLSDSLIRVLLLLRTIAGILCVECEGILSEPSIPSTITAAPIAHSVVFGTTVVEDVNPFNLNFVN